MISVALTIAGSDPSGGAGLQADLKTFHQHGVFGTSVVTLLTVQNTRAVTAIHYLEPAFVLAQLDAVLADVPPVAAKTGALGQAGVIAALADRAVNFGFPLVVDPVMVSKHGAPLIDRDAAEVLRRRLLPHATLVTPNLPEAAALAEMEVTDLKTMEKAAARIALCGVPNVLIKGGRLADSAVDLLWTAGDVHRFAAPRIDSPHTHGTGCVFSAAITARIACGEELSAAVQGAKAFVTHAIRTAPRLGAGCGPINMHAPVEAPASGPPATS
ncbi:MAG: bifunctional hydroxymethylpyrimidine kinase/phosphomethylpyrimidine kinase [Planctomycetota bacterium]